MAAKGFPSQSASKEQMLSFLRGMAKVNSYASDMENAKSDWITSNGSLTSARREMMVNGVNVARGTKFNQFICSRIDASNRGQLPDRPYLSGY